MRLAAPSQEPHRGSRAGRPVLIGTRSVSCARQSVEVIVSPEDELFRHFIGRAVGWFAARCGVSRQGEFLRWWAQRRAERQNARVRQDTTAQDRRLDKELAFAGRAE